MDEYMDCWEKFGETKLSPKTTLCSKLNMKSISNTDHEYAQQVCNTIEEKTLDCYHNTGLKIDVLLLRPSEIRA